MSDGARPSLLYLAHRVPFPPDKGDRIRSFHVLKSLSRKAAVFLGCLADEPVHPASVAALRRHCAEVAVVSLSRRLRWVRALGSSLRGGTITEGAFCAPQLARVIRRWASVVPFRAALVSASSMVSYARLPELASVPTVVDLVDVDSQKWLDYAAVTKGPRGWLYRLEAKRLRRLERELGRWARAVTLVSDEELEIYRRFGGSARAYTISNGVDLQYFQPRAGREEASCVFLGALDYRPNVDGVTWFCNEVWPEVQRRLPAARFRIVGRRPVAAVQRLQRVAGVEVVGTVKDVRPYLADAAISAVPLRMARGVQNKVLESLAMGKAVVASPVSLTGLDVKPGVEVLVASSPAEWVEAILRALGDAGVRRRIGSAGRRYVESHHRWEQRLDPFAGLLGLDGNGTLGGERPEDLATVCGETVAIGKQGRA